MRVICNVEICQGHGRCEAIAPEIFTLDDYGYQKTPVIEVPAGLEDKAHLGVQGCPEEALRIEED